MSVLERLMRLFMENGDMGEPRPADAPLSPRDTVMALATEMVDARYLVTGAERRSPWRWTLSGRDRITDMGVVLELREYGASASEVADGLTVGRMISHPRVVPVVAVYHEHPVVVGVYPRVEGVPLRRSPAPPSGPTTFTLVRHGTEVLEALAALHREGLVHGELDEGDLLLLGYGGMALTGAGIGLLGATSGVIEDLRALVVQLEEVWRAWAPDEDLPMAVHAVFSGVRQGLLPDANEVRHALVEAATGKR